MLKTRGGWEEAGLRVEPDEEQLWTFSRAPRVGNATFKMTFTSSSRLGELPFSLEGRRRGTPLHSASADIGGVTKELKVNRLRLLPERSLSKRH